MLYNFTRDPRELALEFPAMLKRFDELSKTLDLSIHWKGKEREKKLDDLMNNRPVSLYMDPHEIPDCPYQQKSGSRFSLTVSIGDIADQEIREDALNKLRDNIIRADGFLMRKVTKRTKENLVKTIVKSEFTEHYYALYQVMGFILGRKKTMDLRPLISLGCRLSKCPEVFGYLFSDSVKATTPRERAIYYTSFQHTIVYSYSPKGERVEDDVLDQELTSLGGDSIERFVRRSFEEYCRLSRDLRRLPEFMVTGPILRRFYGSVPWFPRVSGSPLMVYMDEGLKIRSRNLVPANRTEAIMWRSCLLAKTGASETSISSVAADKILGMKRPELLRMLKLLRENGLNLSIGHDTVGRIIHWIRDGYLIFERFRQVLPEGRTEHMLYLRPCSGPGLTIRDMIEASGINHRLQHIINGEINQRKVTCNYFMPKPEDISDELEAFRIKTTDDMTRAGMELHHCIGVYADPASQFAFFMKGSVCAQTDLGLTRVIQCYDHRNSITDESRKFESFIRSQMALIHDEKIQESA